METLFGLIGTFFAYTWWIIVPVLLFMGVQQYRRRMWVAEQRYTLLKVSVPKENDKAPVAAEQMFAALHGIHRDSKGRFFEGSVQEHLGLEIVGGEGRINFYVYAPEQQKSFVEGQIYAQYPKAEISVEADYASAKEIPSGTHVAGTELKLTKPDVYPIKTFLNFEDVDPLSGITAVMSDLQPDEHVWIQVLARPADDTWQKRSSAELTRLRGGGSSGVSAGKVASGIGGFIGELFKAATTTPEPGAKAAPEKPVQVDEALVAGVQEKSVKLGYEVKIRLVAIGPDQARAKNRLNSAIGAFKQYNTTNLNGFVAGKISTKEEQVLSGYRGRAFVGSGPILNIEELASVFHLPNTSVETPTISWTASSKGEPPENLPLAENEEKLTVFGETNFREGVKQFGIREDDRRRHVYAIGKTGMGKTNMLENMVVSDIKAGRGLAVVDPHGDFVETVLEHVPADRVNDVIVFNPADRDFPIAFNILEKVDRDAKPLVASGVVGVFEKIYGHSWGPRLEHILRNTILALLDYPDSTLLDVPKLLANEKFRKEVIDHIEDPVVKNFWTDEFGNYTERQRVEAIAPIQNKVGQFLSSSTIRNIMGQKHTAINLREAMDSGKILLIKLSKGELGEDASALLGAMLITKIQLAAMSRADIPEEERKDFYLFVDEFQNFATQSFATILSESRKYRLNLAMANQYVAQMPEEVQAAVFGNVGTIISFRVGANDAQWLVKEFEPVFTETDIVNLDKYHIYLKLAIEGVTGDAFSARTIPLPTETTPYKAQIVEQTRNLYAQPREAVEAEILNESPVIQQANQDDKKRRYQSYLDKERSFSEQRQGSQAAATPAPQPKSAPEKSTQPNTRPARKPHSAKNSEKTNAAKPAQPKPHAKQTPKPEQPKTTQHPSRASKTPQQRSESVKNQPKAAETPTHQPKPQAEQKPAGDLAEDTVIKF